MFLCTLYCNLTCGHFVQINTIVNINIQFKKFKHSSTVAIKFKVVIGTWKISDRRGGEAYKP